jgi:hypothetical protein
MAQAILLGSAEQMSDYLRNIAARSLNLAETLQPRLRSTFEPLSSDTMITGSQIIDETAGIGVHHSEQKLGPRENLHPESASIQEGKMDISTSPIRPLDSHFPEAHKGSMIVQETKEHWHEATSEPYTAGLSHQTSKGISKETEESIDPQIVKSSKKPDASRRLGTGQDTPQSPVRVETNSSAGTNAIISSPKLKGKVISEERPKGISGAIERNYDNRIHNDAASVQEEMENQASTLSAKADKTARAHKRAGISLPLPSETMNIPDYIRTSSSTKVSSLEKRMPGGDIMVSIGRIEVRSSTNAQLPQRKQEINPGSSAMGLKEYLDRRARGGIG